MVNRSIATVVGLPTPDDVRRTLAESDLQLVFQPIVDLRRGAVAGYECLARFAGPPRAAPDVWLSVAGPAGLAEDLETWIVEAALAHRPALPPNTFLSINISPAYLVSSAFAALLQRHEDLSGVVVEVTEELQLPTTCALRRALSALAARGALVAVDDAGTGYSGLGQLLALRPQLVKLDRELIRDLHRDEARSTLAELLGELAGRLDAWLLAEGIETVEELDACIRLGIPLGQGDLLGPPASPFAALPDELSERIVARAASAARPDSVCSLLEQTDTATDIDRARALLDSRGADVVVVVDRVGRPTRLVSRAAPRGVPPLVVSPSTAVVDGARRGMNRPPEERFLPLVVTSGQGRLLGVVRVERIVARLVQLVEPSPAEMPGPSPVAAEERVGASPAQEEGLVKEFRCGDVVPGCTAVFVAADEEGILADLAVHAERDHAMTSVPPELIWQVRERIRTT